jgi:hypothetical protein
LAKRLKQIIPELVEAQQTGFVHGHHIQDNILAVKILEEHTKNSKTPAAMLLLDFAKAYDRVSAFRHQTALRAKISTTSSSGPITEV